jgi:hypothetical protein
MCSDEIWVVVATEPGIAWVMANCDGASRLVKRIAAPTLQLADEAHDALSFIASARSSAMLAKMLSTFLLEGAGREAYESVLIVATPAMRRDLRLTMDHRLHSRIIGEIVEGDMSAPAFIGVLSNHASGSDLRC